MNLLCRDNGSDLLQALLVHRLGKYGIGLAEWIDPVDQIDIQLPHIHRKLPHAVDQCGVSGGLLIRILKRRFFRLLRQIQRRDRVLTHGFLIVFIKLGVLVLDDLAHADLGQLFGH